MPNPFDPFGKKKKCPACHGTGIQYNQKTGLTEKCPVCNGTGKVRQSFGSGKDSGIKFWTKANHRRTDSDGI